MNEIFVSYRRQGSADITGRIRKDLVDLFGEDQVFNDVFSVGQGQNFRKAIGKAIKRCKVYLVVIGPQWLTIEDRDGNRRLDNEDDNVRIELDAALARDDLPIIPLFVGGAQMPHKDDLPEALKGFAYYNGQPIRTGRDYDRDMADLVTALKNIGIKRINAKPGPNGGSSISQTAALVAIPVLLAAIGAALYFGLKPNGLDLPDPKVDPLEVVSEATVQQIQRALNAMDFVAGTEDGVAGASTRAAISAFQRTTKLRNTGKPSSQLLIQLQTAASKGYSNITCSTQNKSAQDCQPVSKTRTVPTTENHVEYLSGVLPCFYDPTMHCDMFGNCNWLAIEQVCENDPAGPAQVQQQCFQYNMGGTITDYDASCSCDPMICGCEVEANCNYAMQTTRLETYTETECNAVSSPQQQCTCRAPEVCPTHLL